MKTIRISRLFFFMSDTFVFKLSDLVIFIHQLPDFCCVQNHWVKPKLSAIFSRIYLSPQLPLLQSESWESSKFFHHLSYHAHESYQQPSRFSSVQILYKYCSVPPKKWKLLFTWRIFKNIESSALILWLKSLADNVQSSVWIFPRHFLVLLPWFCRLPAQAGTTPSANQNTHPI